MLALVRTSTRATYRCPPTGSNFYDVKTLSPSGPKPGSLEHRSSAPTTKLRRYDEEHASHQCPK